VIALVGIVVRTLLLIDFIVMRRAEGLSLEDAVVEAGAVRLRPILLTALAHHPRLVNHGVGPGLWRARDFADLRRSCLDDADAFRYPAQLLLVAGSAAAALQLHSAE
jgi:hypothetical protein